VIELGPLLCAVCVAAGTLPWSWGVRPVRMRTVTVRPAVPAAERTDDLGPVDVVAVLGLLDAAITSGAGLPAALAAVGRALGGEDGRALVRASAALIMGAGWASAWVELPTRLAPVATCLEPTWTTGAAPGPSLRAAAERLVRERRTLAREAAGRLGVRLVIPLGLCFLPAFVLIGLVPVMVSVGVELVR